MVYKNKTYIAFNADDGNPKGDIKYYRLMTAWDKNDKLDFDFFNAHDLNNLRKDSKDEAIKNALRERMKNSKLFILLVGDGTADNQDFVEWEINAAIKREIPIIVVNLNGSRNVDNSLCPKLLQENLSLHISFNQKIIYEAIKNWIDLDKGFRDKKDNSPKVYTAKTYSNMNI